MVEILQYPDTCHVHTLEEQLLFLYQRQEIYIYGKREYFIILNVAQVFIFKCKFSRAKANIKFEYKHPLSSMRINLEIFKEKNYMGL